MKYLFYLKGTKITKVSTIVVGLLGAVAGYFCGDAFAIQTTFYEHIENRYVYNTPLALTIWLSTVLIMVSLILCHCHFRNQEETLNQLDKIALHLSNIEKNTKKEIKKTATVTPMATK